MSWISGIALSRVWTASPSPTKFSLHQIQALFSLVTTLHLVYIRVVLHSPDLLNEEFLRWTRLSGGWANQIQIVFSGSNYELRRVSPSLAIEIFKDLWLGFGLCLGTIQSLQYIITYVGAIMETERLIHHAVTEEVESKDSQVNYLSDMLTFIWRVSFWVRCITWCISLPVLKIQFYKLFVTVFALYIHCIDAKN